jgi:hypothetical protein
MTASDNFSLSTALSQYGNFVQTFHQFRVMLIKLTLRMLPVQPKLFLKLPHNRPPRPQQTTTERHNRRH